MEWERYNIEIPYSRRYGHGQVKVVCPNCKDTRGNPKDTSLSCNLDTGMFNCHHCGWSGCAAERSETGNKNWDFLSRTRQVKEYKKPTHTGNSTLSDKVIAYFAGRGISEATLIKMRVTEGMEWMPQHNREMNTIQFNYYHNGELVNTKFRTGDKKFKLVPGAELLPYNVDAIKGQKYCVICEGEADALSFVECGENCAVSVPNGANSNLSWLDDYIEDYFEDKETIYIASDTDQKGLLLRDELMRRFGADRCKIVTYGEDCKDANECLQKYGKEKLLEHLHSAEEVKVEGIFTVSDFEDSLDQFYETGLQRGLTIGHEEFDKLVSWETKRICVVTGIPSSGKTEFLNEITERLNMRYGWRFGFFSPESAPLAYHAANLIEKITGKHFDAQYLRREEYEQVKNYMQHEFFFIAPEEDFTLTNILDKAKVLVRRKGIKGLVIDPYNRLENEQGNMSETQYISSVLDRLLKFAKKYDVLVFLMAHPTKMPRMQKDKKVTDEGTIAMPNLYDISGSAHFYNKADYGIIVHRNRDEGYTEVKVDKVKFKHLGHSGSVAFKYNINNGRYEPYIPGLEPIWDNDSHFGRWKGKIENEEFERQNLPFDPYDGEEVPF